MTPCELFHLSNSIGNRLDIQLGLFITVHLAIFGGIIYVDRPLRRSKKAGALSIYAGFALIKYLITANLFGYFHSANQDIARNATDACCRKNLLVNQVLTRVEGSGYEIFKLVLLLSHLVMAMLVTVSVIFDRRVAALASRSSTAAADSQA